MAGIGYGTSGSSGTRAADESASPQSRKSQTKRLTQHRVMADRNRHKQTALGNRFTTRKGSFQLLNWDRKSRTKNNNNKRLK
ncbi:hypothetical protein AnigIFM56816_004355 [Aspergillus niger]|nr:hypothetical protein AnigIFM56816_004355 [Aspergillus niger]